ncbi:Putative fluoride ion transporter CrcB [bacterium HR12]|nr:Putative fluoride ion transporter CrcB [bacterium HR12]
MMVRARVGVLAAVALGGAIGSVLRFALEERWAPRGPAAVPVVTLLVNVGGAAALGLLMTLVLEVWPPTRLVRPFLGIGLLGAFTTMSTFALEVVRLARAGAVVAALLYGGMTAAGGLVGVVVGGAAARASSRLPRRGER